MECVEIRGGRSLCGQVEVQGSKNAVLPMLAASVLHAGISRIQGCPRIQDVYDMIELLEDLGCRVWWEGQCLAIDASRIRGGELPAQTASRMRSSVLFLGALLGRTGRARIPYPGGCVLGERPVDLHISAIKALGAQIEEDTRGIRARGRELRGCQVRLGFPSVGATENLILAAVLARGDTVIHNAAREPEVEELCLFLREKGARIRVCPQGRIEIRGVECLQDSRHTLAADRIVAGTYLLAAAVTRGRILLKGAPVRHMTGFLEPLAAMGIRMEKAGECLAADCRGKLQNIGFLQTMPYPGFPTDLQSPMMTLLAVTEGRSRIRENIFESRFKAAQELEKMGARIKIEGRDAVIDGVERLQGTRVEARELRGAAALLLAGLNAAGITRVRGCRFADRGYENFCENLAGLGADIRLIQ